MSLRLLLQKARHRNIDQQATYMVGLTNFLKKLYILEGGKTWMLHTMYNVIDAYVCYKVSVSEIMSIVLELFFIVQ